mmetsp:Transcript_6739/g.20518  ORF Transcript_6739/g.20518 Transcript_6739/m.20518 type:complete len:123 (+) Transcript_6739:390-758(+)
MKHGVLVGSCICLCADLRSRAWSSGWACALRIAVARQPVTETPPSRGLNSLAAKEETSGRAMHAQIIVGGNMTTMTTTTPQTIMMTMGVSHSAPLMAILRHGSGAVDVPSAMEKKEEGGVRR